jgi:lipopolysaccharide transport system ATP-binding protein
MGAIIKVENVSKLYSLKDVGVATIKSDINRFWAKLRGKEDPAFKMAETNDRASKGNSDFVWALKDINFEIQQGDVLGILGRNGAGKSTLLKILSRVAAPTTGQVKMKGRLASLLEVGTGFHADLSGRENIFLNGSILGMTKAEIKKNFDEIVDFSGVERYLDTPVKRYSSGMYVRLAFAVSAYLESEILIIDEVLSVGDGEFQKRCLGKMKDVSEMGRTVLFVSHNILAIKSLCKSAILLEQGKIVGSGTTENVVKQYLMGSNISSYREFGEEDLQANTPQVFVKYIKLVGSDYDNGHFEIDKDIFIEILIENKSLVKNVNTNLFFTTTDGTLIFATCSPSQTIKKGFTKYYCKIPKNFFNDNIYNIDIMVVEDNKGITKIENALSIEGIEPARTGTWLAKFPGLVKPEFLWDVKNVD